MESFLGKKHSYRRKPKNVVSYTMSRIRSKGTHLEYVMSQALRLSGISFRKYYDTFGKPDFVILPYKIAIFCDSCFWHGFNWFKAKNKIRVNKRYWIPKIKKNIERDKLVGSVLKKQGWSIMRFWEYEIYGDINSCLERVIKRIELRGKLD